MILTRISNDRIRRDMNVGSVKESVILTKMVWASPTFERQDCFKYERRQMEKDDPELALDRLK